MVIIKVNLWPWSQCVNFTFCLNKTTTCHDRLIPFKLLSMILLFPFFTFWIWKMCHHYIIVSTPLKPFQKNSALEIYYYISRVPLDSFCILIPCVYTMYCPWVLLSIKVPQFCFEKIRWNIDKLLINLEVEFISNTVIRCRDFLAKITCKAIYINCEFLFYLPTNLVV